MCVDGWIPVDPRTLETSFPGVYAVGDVTSVGTPKAGVFAEGQAAVVAAAIIARAAGAEPDHHLRRQGHLLPRVRLRPGRQGGGRRSSPGRHRTASSQGPSSLLAEDKEAFGTDRIRRWFDRSWSLS